MSPDAGSGAALGPPPPAFDRAALAAYLRANVDDFRGDLVVERFQGGQSNPTYRVMAGSRRYVVRSKPPGPLLPSAHAIEREYRVMAALAGSDVPVARMRALCEDPTVLGTAFYVMDYVEGRVLWDPRLPGMAPADRATHYDELNRVIAALHNVDYAAIGLSDFGRVGTYIERQIARWTKQYQSGGAGSIPAMDRLLEWLPRHVPPGDETRVVHGDFRIDNVIFHPTAPRVLAVLDWELSTLGHPVSDFAYHAMAWRFTPEQWRGIAGSDLAGTGIPTEREYVAAYCRRTGRERIDHLEFYLVFNMFRIAAILHGVHSRALQGNAASDNALEQGARARVVADVAWGMVERAG
jgi:aminoglycoside phosphotransferase (APT) family kinase protein